MTEVRLLYGNEIQWAVNVAREAFVAGMSDVIRSKEQIDRFYGEVTPERLWREGNAGTLFPWGVFHEGALCAVGAMQRDGRITMLYVRPDCQRRGLGLLLLNAMQNQAAALGLPQVTIEVTPVTLAPYFYRRGFVLAPGGTEEKGSVFLECRLCSRAQSIPGAGTVQVRYMPENSGDWLQGKHEGRAMQAGYMPGESQPEILRQEKPRGGLRVLYRKKQVSARAVLLVTAAALTVSFGVIAGITLYHLAAEERYTVKDYYDTRVENEV